MKVAIGYKIIKGPWGGGNKFVDGLQKVLLEKGHLIVNNLVDNDIDIILVIDPRNEIKNIPFGAGSILRYLLFKNPNAIVIHRINECDERKNTKLLNFRLRLTNYVTDHTVFVGTWLKKLNLVYKRKNFMSTVILNGSDKKTFHSKGYKNGINHLPKF